VAAAAVANADTLSSLFWYHQLCAASTVDDFPLSRVCLFTTPDSRHTNNASPHLIAQVWSLIEGNANINVVDQSGSTALHWAARHNAAGCVEALLSSGAVIEKNIHGKTPLDLVSSSRPVFVHTRHTYFHIGHLHHCPSIVGQACGVWEAERKARTRVVVSLSFFIPSSVFASTTLWLAENWCHRHYHAHGTPDRNKTWCF
jgi:hypothetical protein